MTDNVVLNAGSGGDTLAADDVSGVKYQIVKIDVGADGASALLGSSNPIPVSLASVPSHAVTNAGTFAVQAAQSGTWNITNISGTVSLPTGAATAEKQPALGTAGSASTDVLTVQGIASMTALKVDGSAVTQPVSGTFWQATQPVSGTVTANLAAGTNAIGKLAANSGVDIGDVDVLSVPADPFGANADAASATGSISAKLRFIASTGIPITGTVTVGSHAVTNAGTFAVQETGTVTAYKNLDCDESEDDIKTSAGTLYWIHVVNLANAVRYLKFYNATAANTTVGSTTPVLTFPIPTMGDTNGAGFTLSFGPKGVAFSTAICVAATTGLADNNSGAPGANEVVLNAGYS